MERSRNSKETRGSVKEVPSETMQLLVPDNRYLPDQEYNGRIRLDHIAEAF